MTRRALVGVVQVVCALYLSFACAASDQTQLAPKSYFNHQAICSDKAGDYCPPGMFCMNGTCKCGVYPLGRLTCNGTDTFLLKFTCATYDTANNQTVVGGCQVYVNSSQSNDVVLYQKLPNNFSELNMWMCGHYNRTGVLCGHCLPDHYLLAYSYNMTCVPCPHVGLNWFCYVVAAYLPLTLFYCLVVIFNINTTSSHLFALLYYCQTFATPYYLRMIAAGFEGSSPAYFTTVKIFLSFYGIWNLDFFRPFYNRLCLGIEILPTLALDYAIALYPLLLIAVTHFLLKLYEKEERLVVLLWRPFKAPFSSFQRQFDVRTSRIDAYATILFLALMKLFSVSFDLLLPTPVYHLQSDKKYHWSLGLFYRPDIVYFGDKHLPYAVTSLVVLILCILPAIVLAVYPFHFFRKCLHFLPIRWYVLQTFMDTFQGCYKDGTDPGTRDYRWFASTFYFLRILHFFLLALPDGTVSLGLSGMAVLLFTVVIATLQPFKSSYSHHNMLTIIFLQFLALLAIVGVLFPFSLLLNPGFTPLFFTVAALLGATPFFYTVAMICHWIYKHRKFRVRHTQRIDALVRDDSEIEDSQNSPIR